VLVPQNSVRPASQTVNRDNTDILMWLCLHAMRRTRRSLFTCWYHSSGDRKVKSSGSIIDRDCVANQSFVRFSRAPLQQPDARLAPDWARYHGPDLTHRRLARRLPPTHLSLLRDEPPVHWTETGNSHIAHAQFLEATCF
jgi:hypothetical protein